MGLKCGIVGLPNVGKSTLFNCLSNAKAQAANFPFCTIEPNLGVITVPDARLNVLVDIVQPQNVVPATVEIVDIAGLVQGASKGEGLGNKFLSNIRETNAILHVLRCFDDPNIVHVHGSVDPIRDKEIIDAELQLKDLESVEKKLQKVDRAAKTGDKDAKKAQEVLNLFMDALNQGKSARSVETTPEDREHIADLFLLTDKPVLYVCNIDEAALKAGVDNEWVASVRKMAATENAGVMVVSAAVESEIAELESQDDRELFLSEYGLTESGVQKLIMEAYKLLKLQTYFTAGEKEVRAWTVPIGATAPQAAGEIHTDFEKGFIRAEVIKLADFEKYRSWSACREAGKTSVEGKAYIVEDGDIMLFRFNV